MVIAIIAVLAALLMPALKSARETAKRVACVSNIRQIHIGLLAYAGDYSGLLPITGGWLTDFAGAGAGPPRGLGFLCIEYAANYGQKGYLPRKTFDCPGSKPAVSGTYNRFCTYAYATPWNGTPNISVAQAGTESARSASWNSPPGNPRGLWRAFVACAIHQERTGFPEPNPTHADRGVNVSWADGSVRWLARRSTNSWWVGTGGMAINDSESAEFWKVANDPTSY